MFKVIKIGYNMIGEKGCRYLSKKTWKKLSRISLGKDYTIKEGTIKSIIRDVGG